MCGAVHFNRAVDGRALRMRSLQEAGILSSMFAVNRRGGAACTLSHLAVWMGILDHAIPFAVVLEDDVHLGDGFREKLVGQSQTQ